MTENGVSDHPNLLPSPSVQSQGGCSPGCQGFSCARGYDPVSGLGSPNVAAMKAYVAKLEGQA